MYQIVDENSQFVMKLRAFMSGNAVDVVQCSHSRSALSSALHSCISIQKKVRVHFRQNFPILETCKGIF